MKITINELGDVISKLEKDRDELKKRVSDLEEALEMSNLRFESMANAWIPEGQFEDACIALVKPDGCFFDDCVYDRTFDLDAARMGMVHKSKKKAIAWAEKYADAFEYLFHKKKEKK